jgi:hypothetical protein
MIPAAFWFENGAADAAATMPERAERRGVFIVSSITEVLKCWLIDAAFRCLPPD